MHRTLFVLAMLAMSGSVFLIAEGQSDACGVKLSVKGRTMRRHSAGAKPTRTLVALRPTKTSRDERRPIQTGPQREMRGAPVDAGGATADSREVKETGGGATDPAPVETATPTEPTDTPADPIEKPARRKRVAATDTDSGSDDSESSRSGKVSGRVFFENGESELNAQSRTKLRGTLKWLQKRSGRSVTVEGHASAIGSLDANQALSDARAEAVKSFLVEHGIDESRVETKGFGMERPEYKPSTSGKNRRVIIRINP